MLFARKHLTIIGLILALLAASVPVPVFAALGIDSILPNLVFNDVVTTIEISGTDFLPGAVVSLKNYGNLATSFESDTLLKAVVRPGTPPGTYTVIVTNPALPPVEYPNGLTIADPSPVPTVAPPPFARPQMVVKSSGVNGNQISSGKEFKFNVNFENAGNMAAFNAQVVFSSADLVPLKTGGVVVMGNVAVGSSASIDQRFVSSAPLYGKTFVLLDVTLTYYDDKGTSYSDKFTLTLPVAGGGGGTGSYATATPTGVRSGQLIIPSYGTTINPLQPGSQFTLTMTIQNAGNDKAQRVTMIVGGGSSGGGSGTPQAGGVSGAGGGFENFAPVGTSNIQSLGDIPSGGMAQVSQDLIVNVSTNPGAYPMKITFSYLNSRGEAVNDDQVITLLVYSLPNLEISFYRPLDLFFSGQPGALPIQVVNLGKRTAVLGNMTVTSDNGIVENSSTLVGSLDPGGYFTMDSIFYPDVSGGVKLNLMIEYTDDFNQPRTIEKTLEVNVEEEFVGQIPDPSLDGGGGGGGGGGGDFFPVEETFLQKTWRFILGLLGLDSAPPASSPDMQVPPIEELPVPNPGGGGKG